MLTNSDIAALRSLRHTLQRAPEISGEEEQTAKTIVTHLGDTHPDEVVTGLGGHGVAAVFQGANPGLTLLFRCELDALPIQENPRPHQSLTKGKAHLCGHDGHMTILLGLARLLHKTRPAKGRVVLMFQPAEETGDGGPGVVADPKFAPLRPDMAFSLHNMPGLPLGYAGLTTGPVASASRGMTMAFQGHESHSSDPQNACSPRAALADLMQSLPALSSAEDEAFRRITVTHVQMGIPSFGITPGAGKLLATLRTQSNSGMADLVHQAEALAHKAAEAEGLNLTISYAEIFEHLENAPEAVAVFRQALDALNIPHGEAGGTMTPSEDFAAFSHLAPSAMLYLGAGEQHPPLHTPDYDFPDDLIPIGAHLFHQVVKDLLG